MRDGMDYQKRIRTVQKYLKSKRLDGIIVDNPLNIFYLTGIELSMGTLLVTEKFAQLVIDNRYFESCKPRPYLFVMRWESGWLIKLLQQKRFAKVNSLGFDSENTSYDKYLIYRKEIKQLKKDSVGERIVSLKPLQNPIRTLRTIKDGDEVAALKEAAHLGSQGFDFVSSLLQEGVTELELANKLEIFWKERGSKGVAFESIIAFGSNSSMPHYKPSTHKLKRGNPVLIDIGVNLAHYHSDMSRVLFYGKPSKQMEEIYEIVLEAQEAAITLAAPGIPLFALDTAARDCIARHGYEKYFIHSLGHGIGLEVHEYPFFKKKDHTLLEAGMVLTIEPGIYLPGIGGVRIEDTILITKGGHENLTQRPKNMIILEDG